MKNKKSKSIRTNVFSNKVDNETLIIQEFENLLTNKYSIKFAYDYYLTHDNILKTNIFESKCSQEIDIAVFSSFIIEKYYNITLNYISKTQFKNRIYEK